SSLLASNLLTVSAIDRNTSQEYSIETVKLADYANYSLERVHVAAPVPALSAQGLYKTGTSFTAPYVSSVIDQLRYSYPEMSAQVANEIVMKSSDVKNIKAAIAATEDLILSEQLGVESVVMTAMTHKKREIRLQLQNQIGDILLVKSGGVVNPERAFACAQRHFGSEKLSVSESCLKSHQAVGELGAEGLEDLSRLWDLRAI
ncbi:MAG: hypothetical protein AAF202_13280, partial [Pseudomonadota bacterium]